MLTTLAVAGFRSLREVVLPLGPVTGEVGCAVTVNIPASVPLTAILAAGGEASIEEKYLMLPNMLKQKKYVRATHSAVFCDCLLYTSPSPRDRTRSRMPSSA